MAAPQAIKPAPAATPLRIRKYLQKFCDILQTPLHHLDLEDEVVNRLCTHMDGTKTAKDIVLQNAQSTVLAILKERQDFLSKNFPLPSPTQTTVGESEHTLVSLGECANSFDLDAMPAWVQKSLTHYLQSEHAEEAWNQAADEYWEEQVGEALNVAKRVDFASCTDKT